ncbi:MAG: phosphoadenosine phosphosulfate reductase family protein [Anaerolineae bacterium]|nr:phosphoadenosine phosphosulfate reductase family protein [Anaerolineae bacterium]
MADQLPLFPLDENPAPDPLALLRQGAALVLSVSGGKDSDAMSHWLLDQRLTEGWCGPVKMVHADLGRADWHMTGDYVEGLAKHKGVELHVVRWLDGDLIDRIWQRWEKDKTRPCWPSAAARYCTSDLKRGPISRWIRHTFPTGAVICAMGLRAGESQARARRPTVTIREDCTSQGRRVLNWLPIHAWTESQVWSCIQSHGGIRHPAYNFGNRRLSCACCVLANTNDLLNGAIHNPATYQELCRIEAVTGYSFKKGWWLSDLRPELLPAATLEAVRSHQQRLAVHR